MKYVVAFIFFFTLINIPSLIFPSIDSNPADLEKLKKELPSLSGKKKVDALNHLSSQFVVQSPGESLLYAGEAHKLALEIHYELGEAFSLRALGDANERLKQIDLASKYYQEALILFSRLDRQKDLATIYNKQGYIYRKLKDYKQALAKHQLALVIYEKLQDQYEIAYTLYKIGNDFSDLDQNNEAIKSYERALQIRRTLGNPEEVADILTNIGLVYYNIGQYDQALDYFQQALETYRSCDCKEEIASSLGHLGLIYDLKGDYPKAIDYHMQALKLHEELGDKDGMAGAYNNIGVIYVAMEKNEQGLEYYLKALALEEQYGDPINVSIMTNNIGIIYRKLKNYDKAFAYYRQSLAIAEKTSYKRGISRVYINFGIAYADLKQNQKAIEYYNKALVINTEIDNQFGIASNHHALATSYLAMKNFPLSQYHLKKALALAESLKIKELIRDCYDNLSSLYLAQQKYQPALEYYKQWVKHKDQLINEATNTKIAELKTKYETEKKEQRITLLEKNNQLLTKNNEIQNLKLSQERFKTKTFIIGFILVIIIALLILKKYFYLFAFWKKRNYIAHYKIIDQIGAGGMGIIYKATHIRSQSEPVAVKIIREEFSKDETQRKRFLNEALLVDQLDHPHIIKVFERGEFNQQLYIAMEMLDGPSLATIIHQGIMIPLHDCISIMNQLAETISRIHSKGILHRDIKPDNIILIKKNENPFFVKLLDFGLAINQSLTRLTGSGEILGTINYLPPEQISQRDYSPASDIYSLGVVFYELLTLQQPFIGEFPIDIIQQILYKNPIKPREFRAELPGNLENLVMHMIEKEPLQRPPEEVIINTLTQYLDESTLEATR